MLAVLIILAAIVVTPPGKLGEFSRNGNGVPAYEIVKAEPCESGLRNSGYAVVPSTFVPGDSVVLKQENPDGTVTEPVCSN